MSLKSGRLSHGGGPDPGHPEGGKSRAVTVASKGAS